MKKSGKKKTGRRIFNVIIVLMILVGVGIILYPTFSDYWNRYRNSLLLTQYSETIGGIDEDSYSEIMAQAVEYNKEHRVNVIVDAFEQEDRPLTAPYDQLLDPMENGVMGSVEIPKIKQNLVIYHGTGAKELEQGVGHVEGTSLPVGGDGTHCVLAAHRGLPSARLFTDIDQMEEGDVFYLHILGDTLAYEVDRISVVEPYEVQELDIVPQEDLVTLLTCTPYAVNTHRLLVRGHRIPYAQENSASKTSSNTIAQSVYVLPLPVLIGATAVVMAIILVVAILLTKTHRKRQKPDASRRDADERGD